MPRVHSKNLVALKNANGTVDLFERTFDGDPWGYGNASYRWVECDIIVEPKPVAARIALALVGLAAALASLAGVVLLATWLPQGLA